MSLSEIVEKIQPRNRMDEVPSDKIDLLATRVAEVVKEEIYSFFKKDK